MYTEIPPYLDMWKSNPVSQHYLTNEVCTLLGLWEDWTTNKRGELHTYYQTDNLTLLQKKHALGKNDMPRFCDDDATVAYWILIWLVCKYISMCLYIHGFYMNYEWRKLIFIFLRTMRFSKLYFIVVVQFVYLEFIDNIRTL